MSFWRTSEARIRWMLVLGLIQVLRMAMDLHVFGAGNLRWLESLSWAVACLAGIPLEEPSHRRLPWQRQLRTPSGLLFNVGMVVSLGLFLWNATHDRP